jgi:hypothetical protein
MADSEDLARRYLALWQDYLSALLAEPATAELWQKWLALCPSATDDRAAAGSRSTRGAAAAAGASGERDAVLAELARRLAGVEERLDALERRRRRTPPRPRERNRGGRP